MMSLGCPDVIGISQCHKRTYPDVRGMRLCYSNASYNCPRDVDITQNQIVQARVTIAIYVEV